MEIFYDLIKLRNLNMSHEEDLIELSTNSHPKIFDFDFELVLNQGHYQWIFINTLKLFSFFNQND
jgi:hypothetical protein